MLYFDAYHSKVIDPCIPGTIIFTWQSQSNHGTWFAARTSIGHVEKVQSEWKNEPGRFLNKIIIYQIINRLSYSPNCNISAKGECCYFLCVWFIGQYQCHDICQISQWSEYLLRVLELEHAWAFTRWTRCDVYLPHWLAKQVDNISHSVCSLVYGLDM